jgi:hypothetical protein
MGGYGTWAIASSTPGRFACSRSSAEGAAAAAAPKSPGLPTRLPGRTPSDCAEGRQDSVWVFTEAPIR